MAAEITNERTIQKIGVVFSAQSRDADFPSKSRVRVTRRSIHRFSDTRIEENEFLQVSTIQRQIPNRRILHEVSHGCIFRLNQRSFTRNLYSLGYRPDRQLKIHHGFASQRQHE